MNAITNCIGRYGTRVTVTDTRGAVTGAFTAIISPLRYKNKMYVEPVPTEIGTSGERYYTLIAPPDASVPEAAGGRLRDAAGEYYALKIETVCYKNKPAYVWAVLRKTEV